MRPQALGCLQHERTDPSNAHANCDAANQPRNVSVLHSRCGAAYFHDLGTIQQKLDASCMHLSRMLTGRNHQRPMLARSTEAASLVKVREGMKT